MKNTFDAIIVGGGPAGMMAAITAAERGRRILLLEKKDLPGRKLLISGKGRCNLTNTGDVDVFLEKFSQSGNFLRNCFHIFFNSNLMDFFRKNGVKLKVERGKRVFPESDSARDILKALLDNLKKAGALLLLNSEGLEIKKNGYFNVLTSKKENFISENLLLATGGVSYPGTGSAGFGFSAASKFGHKVIKPKPGLVGLNVKMPQVKRMQGVSLKNISCSVLCNNKNIRSSFGEMIFTHYGVSGPVILDISGLVYDLLEKKQDVCISIDLKPALTYDGLKKRIVREIGTHKNKNLDNIAKNLLPKKMTVPFLNLVNIPPQKKVNQITKSERTSLIKGLKGLKLEVISTRSIDEAIVTRGGVSTKEIYPKTMESKIIKGLFFAGEVIDVDAKTGGYNMQAAFSTGYVAGLNI